LLKERYRVYIDSSAQKFVRYFIKRDINPHYYTIIGFLINIISTYYILKGRWIIAALSILFAGAFDIIDGASARLFNRVTQFGAILDSVIDRYSDMLPLVGLIAFYSSIPNVKMVILASITLLGTAITPYVKARSESFIPRFNIGFMERGERILLISIGLLLNIMSPILWILAITTHLTVIQRTLYAKKRIP
jgi:CDP-diacylglycerol--glycerol-3-phosphate 3-phosphatidyltransferase